MLDEDLYRGLATEEINYVSELIDRIDDILDVYGDWLRSKGGDFARAYRCIRLAKSYLERRRVEVVYTCPECGGRVVKLDKPLDSFEFACVNCGRLYAREELEI